MIRKLLALSLTVTALNASSQTQVYYRLISPETTGARPTNTLIRNFLPDGAIQWDAPKMSPTNRYSIQWLMRFGETQTPWVEVMSGNVTNRTMGARPPQPTLPPPPASEMSLIPDGEFAMGNPYNALGEGWPDELPVHTVRVSAIYMDRFEVTAERFKDVYNWAYSNGLIAVRTQVFTNNAQVLSYYGPVNLEGSQKLLLFMTNPVCNIGFANNAFYVKNDRTNFPVIEVSWYGAAAFCNYRGDREGLPRAYDFAPSFWTCNFTNKGYRLPTEAEFEKASRGGLAGQHYPWPNDPVQGTNNYWWNFSPTMANAIYLGYPNNNVHPWMNEMPPLTPVGYYDGHQVISNAAANARTNDMANGYGLYDMAGNVREWCWDWYTNAWYSNPNASRPNPTGPSAGNIRVTRGGSWNTPSGFGIDVGELRCGYRGDLVTEPFFGDFETGFRCVRGL